jgi:hypothetical protein
VVRSYLGFPNDLYDGALVYEGLSATVNDTGALGIAPVMYYSVFVIGADGSVSSGAVVSVRKESPGSGEVVTSTTTEPTEGEEAPVDETPILIPLLESSEIMIRQGESTFSFLDENIELVYDTPFTISIAREALPRHLKSIIVSLPNPTDQRQRYAFLLRLNAAGTAYEATLSPLSVLGESRLTIEVYDFEQLVIGRYSKTIVFSLPLQPEPIVIFPDMILTWLAPLPRIVAIIFIVLAVIGLLLWWRRRDEDKV